LILTLTSTLDYLRRGNPSTLRYGLIVQPAVPLVTLQHTARILAAHTHCCLVSQRRDGLDFGGHALVTCMPRYRFRTRSSDFSKSLLTFTLPTCRPSQIASHRVAFQFTLDPPPPLSAASARLPRLLGAEFSHAPRDIYPRTITSFRNLDGILCPAF